MLTFICYMEVYLTFALLDCVVIMGISLNVGALFHIFSCNFGQTEENRSLYRGLRYREVRYIEVPMYNDTHKKFTTCQRDFGG